MRALFETLEGIIESDYTEQTLSNLDDIVEYADSDIDFDDAKKIQTVGLKWLDDMENGNGEWSRMRHEAKAALDDK